jgi:hypothetical protein
MAADAWVFFQSFREYVGDGTIDLDDDVFKISLYTSSLTPDAATQTVKGDLSNEVTGSGYAEQTCAATWTRSGATVTFDCADATFTASGGDIVCRFAVLWDDTPSSPADPLVAYSLLDNTPADVTTVDGTSLTIQINASGVFTLS